jgi:hypothetical protein
MKVMRKQVEAEILALTESTLPRLILWNQHNAQHKDRGTKTIRLSVYMEGDVVFTGEDIEVKWSNTKDPSTELTLPVVKFDRIRIDITRWVGGGGGLSEVQLFHGGRNQVSRAKISSSGILQDNAESFGVSKLNDGIVSSDKFAVGYWLLPNSETGWIDLKWTRTAD